VASVFEADASVPEPPMHTPSVPDAVHAFPPRVTLLVPLAVDPCEHRVPELDPLDVLLKPPTTTELTFVAVFPLSPPTMTE
jgi:hypothetical protein